MHFKVILFCKTHFWPKIHNKIAKLTLKFMPLNVAYNDIPSNTFYFLDDVAFHDNDHFTEISDFWRKSYILSQISISSIDLSFSLSHLINRVPLLKKYCSRISI